MWASMVICENVTEGLGGRWTSVLILEIGVLITISRHALFFFVGEKASLRNHKTASALNVYMGMVVMWIVVFIWHFACWELVYSARKFEQLSFWNIVYSVFASGQIIRNISRQNTFRWG